MSTAAIDDALVAYLQADAALAALLPDGVWYDEAPPNATRYAIVARLAGLAADVAAFGHGRAIEDYLFLIKAVIRSTAMTSGPDAAAAGDRIEALIEDVPLAVSGYTWSTSYRTEYVRLTEKDEIDPSLRWFHRGGRYRVQMYRL